MTLKVHSGGRGENYYRRVAPEDEPNSTRKYKNALYMYVLGKCPGEADVELIALYFNLFGRRLT